MSDSSQKNIILLVGYGPAYATRVQRLRELHGDTYRYGLLYQQKAKDENDAKKLEVFDVTIRCNMNSPKAIAKALLPYQQELRAVTCTADATVPLLQKVIPHVPYLRTPTTESLTWSTDKLQMRRRLSIYDRSIIPHYRIVQDTKKETLRMVEEKVGFPVVVKPLGLAASMLVSVAYHPEELEKTLKTVFRKINKAYRDRNGRGEPSVMVEELMEGDMYSVDAYVNSRGKVFFTPFCSIKTGWNVGYDDFFAYQTITPSTLSKQSAADARDVSETALHALGLRSTSAHIELMKTEEGWKVIEVGPRIGGFRDKMYEWSYGIDHITNDIRIRIPAQPKIPRTTKGHSAVMKIYGKAEGKIKHINGVKKIQHLSSFQDIKQHKNVGDRAVFAKHGGDSIFNVYLFHTDRSKLRADMRRLEKTVSVEVE